MSRRIARPYAAALYQVLSAREVPELRRVEAQLALAAELFRQEPTVLRVFEVPTVTPERKRVLLEEISKALELSAEARRLLAALAQHFRLRYLPQVVEAFRTLVDRREGMVRGRVVLAEKPSSGQVEKLAAALQASLGERVELDTVVDGELLAGFVVRLGSRVFDGSLRSRVRKFAAAAGSR